MKTLVVKIGGSTLGSQDTTYQDLVELQKKGLRLIVVHGGGKTITEWLGKQGSGTSFVNGQRVTDRAALDVVVAVLAGLVNKDIVAALNSLGGRAAGLSGIDGSLIKASIMRKDFGYIGKIEEIKPDILLSLLEDGYIAVVAPPCLYTNAAKGEPGFLNVNADTVAGALAKALKAESLIFLTDVPGIYDQNKKIINELNEMNARTFVKTGVISEGMIPKIEACLEGAQAVKTCRIIDGRVPHALLKDLEGTFPGTSVVR